jgi:3-oxoacyl-[acyl-carrier-protein] synthase II
VVTPIGADLDAFWSALLAGADGVSAIERFPVDDLRVRRGGEIKKLPAPSRRIAAAGRAAELLACAAEDLAGRAGPGGARRAGGGALAAFGVAPGRVAVVVGTALGGVEEGERALAGTATARRAAAALYDAPARALARYLGARGPAITVSTACASGSTALGLGADLLRDGRADLVIAGGYDVLCRFVMRGFDVLRSLTRDRVRPFDRRRSGLLLGEAAALVLLARDADARGPRLGRLLGHASTSDGSHIAAPDPGGRGLDGAIRGALAEAGAEAADVDFVSAHGTGTPLNDRIEAAVLRRVLGARAESLPVNAIKGALGHTMGAAAALEAITCLLASRHGVVPPTAGFEEPDPECGLAGVSAHARQVRPRVSLSTSLGFGGCNAALVLEGG